MIGPIAIKNARPGMTLEIKINDIVPGWYGWNFSGGERNLQDSKLGNTLQEELRVDWLLDHEKIRESAN